MSNLYVDQEAGDDTNSCMGPGNNACEHIQAAVNKAGTDDTIHVADPSVQTVYGEQVNLTGGKSLVSDSADKTENVIEGGAGSAISVFGATGVRSTVQGFTIRGHTGASLQADHPVEIHDNVFDEPGPIGGGYSSELTLGSTAGDSVVSGNTFVDPDPVAGQPQSGIATSSTGAPQISNNSFADLTVAIDAVLGSGQPLIAHNTIKGTRPVAGQGFGIRVFDGTPTISDNSITSPALASSSDHLDGISVQGYGAPNVGATLARNKVVGLTRSIDVEDAGAGVSLHGDLIAQSTKQALFIIDPGADDPTVSDVTATNVTVADTDTGAGGVNAQIGQAKLTLDSSVFDTGAITIPGGDGTCAISFSRGPSIGNAASGCDSFQTTDDPTFVDPAAGDYRLASGSPMIDAGDPADPANGDTDLDGDARAIAGVCGGTVRRDIGADEFKPSCSSGGGTGGGGSRAGPSKDTDAPETTIAKGPKRKVKARKKVKATFKLGSSEAGSSFECKLDKGSFKPCASPAKYKVKRGKHTFQVSAADAAGNVDPTPATFKFKVVGR